MDVPVAARVALSGAAVLVVTGLVKAFRMQGRPALPGWREVATRSALRPG